VPAAIEFDGALTVVTPTGASLNVTGEGETLVIDAPTIRSLAALRAARTAPTIRSALKAMRRSSASPNIDLRVRGRTVAVLRGRGVPDALGRLLRLGPMRIKPLALLKAACGLA
jgi:hypothetical protein